RQSRLAPRGDRGAEGGARDRGGGCRGGRTGPALRARGQAAPEGLRRADLPAHGGTPPPGPRAPRGSDTMLTGALFAFVAIGFPTVVFVKIERQRRVLGRSPVILGRAGGWQGWFERLAPLALCFWPAAWLWVAAGGAPIASGPRYAVG